APRGQQPDVGQSIGRRVYGPARAVRRVGPNLEANVISTHVLDTMNGRPAAGMKVRLYRDGQLLANAVTDADGRVKPLASEIVAGVHEIVFHVAEYFGLKGTPFLGEVLV